MQRIKKKLIPNEELAFNHQYSYKDSGCPKRREGRLRKRHLTINKLRGP
jgi:hypothetical protein